MRELLKKLAPEGMKKVYRTIRKKTIEAEFSVFAKLPIQKKRIVLCNVWGYGDNPKWIARALRMCDKSLEIIFVAGGVREHISNGIHFVPNNSLKAAYYLSTAHVWVDCNRKEPYISKRPEQVYVQTWHGSIPLKKIEGDYEGLTEEYMDNARRDSAMTDLYISNGKFIEGIYGRAFGYSGQCLRAGSARLDPLINPNSRRVYSTKKKLKVLAHVKTSDDVGIAVYAPTFRDKESKSFSDFDAAAIIEALEKKYSKEFILVVRLHPIEAQHVHVMHTNKIVAGNAFGDLYELLEAADVLITDYSNTMFEFALAGRDVFLYAPDEKEYVDERGMYFDYNDLPFPRAVSTEGMTDIIANYSPDEYRNRQKQFFDDLEISENGHSSVTIARAIISKAYYH